MKLGISNADKEEMLQNLSQMGQPQVMGRMMGGHGGKPGGHGHGHGGGPPMGGHGGMNNGGMEVPSCVKKMMMMICSKRPQSPKPHCKPLTTCKVEEYAMEMLDNMMRNVQCDCMPIK